MSLLFENLLESPFAPTYFSFPINIVTGFVLLDASQDFNHTFFRYHNGAVAACGSRKIGKPWLCSRAVFNLQGRSGSVDCSMKMT